MYLYTFRLNEINVFFFEQQQKMKEKSRKEGAEPEMGDLM